MKKNIIPIVLFLSLACGATAATNSSAVYGMEVLAPGGIQQQNPKYTSFEGEIESIQHIPLGPGISDIDRIVVTAADGSQNIYNVLDSTKLFNAATMEQIQIADLKEKQKVQVFHNNNGPALAIYPPQYTPDVLVVKDENSFRSVAVDTFDKNGHSLDGNLVINVSDQTAIFDLSGKKLSKEDIADKDLVVFYSITTRSIPPQTPPERVIVLSDANPNEGLDENIEFTKAEILNSLAEEQVYKSDGTVYMRVADVARDLGFNVSWDNNTRTVSISKESKTIIIKIGDTDYKYMDSVKQLKNPPMLINDRTFVEIGFLDDLL